ncbi:hypothetical protein FRB97_008922 [Tulasnella sp. 331]|nr:hypothetical protein FRB97_008922 [Tulasnella sp. 331]KAG8873832.1 hypothetical protein FRB98_008770 [Tulasnella sp. 332]
MSEAQLMVVLRMGIAAYKQGGQHDVMKVIHNTAKRGKILPIKKLILIHRLGALRVAKNYTKGYSDVQAKVRDATSNDPWGPSGTQMNELAQMTYNQQEFVEIMEMLDKRLNDKGKNWRHVFKALTVLDYCLHAGSENVVLYFKDNIYIIKTLKEFQYIDEDMKDQGANVRQKAKDISNLLMDESRLRDQRRSRAHMRDRMVNGQPVGNDDDENENVRRRSQSVPPSRGPTNGQRRSRKEEDDLKKALELSKRSLEEENERHGRLTAEERDLAEALKLSKEEEAKRLKAIEDSNSRALFDDGTQLSGPTPTASNPFPLIDTSLGQQQSLHPQFTANPYWAQQQQQLASQQAQQQAEYEWMLQQQQQQQQQQAQLQAIQQQQQESWMRQQMLIQQQEQQQQALYQQQLQDQQQQQFFQPQIQPQPTGYGSNNPFALAAGTANFSSPAPPVPSFDFAPAASPAPQPQQYQPQQYQPQQYQPQQHPPRPQSQPSSFSTPQPPSPTTANTQANARRPNVITSNKHSELNSLFANRDDGQDTFGNIGALRYGSQAGALLSQSTGTNPFAKTNGASQQQQPRNDQPFFSI